MPASVTGSRCYGAGRKLRANVRDRGFGNVAKTPFVATASHPHDDLADLLVRLQVAMSLDDLLKREGLGDDRLQAAISQALVDETFPTLQSGRVERDLRHPKAAQDDELGHQLQGGHSCRLRPQGPVDEDDAVGHRRPTSFSMVGPPTGSKTTLAPLPPVRARISLTRSCSSVATTWVAPASSRACLTTSPARKPAP